MLATEINFSFQVTKEVFPIIRNLGKARLQEKPFFPQQGYQPIKVKVFGSYGPLQNVPLAGIWEW